MIDPVTPQLKGTVLDIERLRALINDPKLSDDMEVVVSVGDGEFSHIDIGRLELVLEENEPLPHVHFKYTLPDFTDWVDFKD